jgi:hypothetical protein
MAHQSHINNHLINNNPILIPSLIISSNQITIICYKQDYQENIPIRINSKSILIKTYILIPNYYKCLKKIFKLFILRGHNKKMVFITKEQLLKAKVNSYIKI